MASTTTKQETTRMPLRIGEHGFSHPYQWPVPVLARDLVAWAKARIDFVSLLAFFLPFLLYIQTLAPTIYNLDSAELTTAAATGGIVRATGYPLYLMLGRIWAQIPIGDVGFRMNLMSAAAGALTIVLSERILRRLGVGKWARFAALGLLATAPYFWGLSLIAEVYTMHTLMMAAVILLLMRWRERPGPLRLGVAVGVAALSLGNHAATVLLVPACIFFVLASAPRELRRVRTWIAVIAGLLLGISVYLYLPLLFFLEPNFNYAGWFNDLAMFMPVNLGSPEGLWWLISGKSFSGQMFAYSLPEFWHEAGGFGIQLWGAFFAVGIGPGLLGILTILRREWRLGLFFCLIFLANALFYINYRVIDKNTMYLPAYLVWAIWAGIGFQQIFNWFGDLFPDHRKQYYRWLVPGIVITVVLFAAAWNWGRVDLSNDWSTRNRGESILSNVEEDAIVFGWWDTVPVIEYLQLVEGERLDVKAINRFLISGDDMERLIDRQIDLRPIYINSPPAALLNRYGVERVGSVYKLLPESSRKTLGGDQA